MKNKKWIAVLSLFIISSFVFFSPAKVEASHVPFYGDTFSLIGNCGDDYKIDIYKFTVYGLCPSLDGVYTAEHALYRITDTGIVTPESWIGDASKEDAAIAYIAANGTVTLRDGNGNHTIPATNCPRIAGPDPEEYARTHGGKQPIKIVFMRDSSIETPAERIALLAKYVAEKGFKTIYPYSEYYDDFSFYVDFKKVDLPLSDSGTIFNHSPDSYISSSCPVSGKDKQVLFFGVSTVLETGYTFHDGKVVFINALRSTDNIFTVVHEVSHALGRLNDEYVLGTSGNVSVTVEGLTRYQTTCSIKPAWDYRGSDNIIYGSVLARGCGFLRTTEVRNSQDYFRPSNSSIMNISNTDDHRFNVISCGYLIEAIKGGEASSHWPRCLEAAKQGKVIKDGIPPRYSSSQHQRPPYRFS